MANFNKLFSNTGNGGTPAPKKKGDMKITYLHYSKLVRSQYQYCDAKEPEIENLADLILADGKVLQNLIVRKVDVDSYEIIAGHKRQLAVKKLVEERGLEKYAQLPCIVMEADDVKTRFAVVSSNMRHEKTPYEILHEIEEMRELLTNYPEAFPELKGGRMVERLAEQLHMARSTVSDYRTIANNLGEKGMEALKNGEVDKSAAVELAGLPHEEQEQLLDGGKTKYAEIKAYKKEKQEAQSQEETVLKKSLVKKLIEEHEKEKLPALMRICRENQLIKICAKKVQELLAPNGYSGVSSNGFDYTLHGFSKGVILSFKNETAKMSYQEFTKILMELYDPYDREYLEEDIKALAKTVMDKGQDARTEEPQIPEEMTHIENRMKEEDAPEEPMENIPQYSRHDIQSYLEEEEKMLSQYIEVNSQDGGMPEKLMKRQVMKVEGLKMLLRLAKEKEAEEMLDYLDEDVKPSA